MELAHALQRAGVLKRERVAQEPVTVGPELAERSGNGPSVTQRACRPAQSATSPTSCQYAPMHVMIPAHRGRSEHGRHDHLPL